MESSIMNRAFSAYFKTAGTATTVAQPSASESDLVEVEGLKYAVLRNVRGLLAVYRVTNSGQLKRLKRYPKGLE